jgi:ankyrin repeat protein
MRWRTGNSSDQSQQQPQQQPAHDPNGSQYEESSDSNSDLENSSRIDDDEQDFPDYGRYDDHDVDFMDGCDPGESSIRGILPSASEFEELVGDFAQTQASFNLPASRNSQLPISAATSLVSLPPPDGHSDLSSPFVSSLGIPPPLSGFPQNLNTNTSSVTSNIVKGPSHQHDDDTGQDHAIPDDGNGVMGPTTAWTPQNQQSTCEFTHTITHYSSKRDSGCKKAEYSNTTVDSFGNRWRLIVYVNGNGRATNHHLSMFLQVADAEELPFGWKKAVSYVLTLEHPSGPSLGYAKRNPDKTFKLCPKAIDWGWSQFITSDRIQQEGYISNDSLTVRASVTVKSSSISIDQEDAELYLKCAVEEGNADAVEACLAQGASVNCQFKDDLYTPLHTACSSSASEGSFKVLELLLKRGADGNACNKWRETPLLIAANNGHKAAVEALLKYKADPSLCSEAGWSALTFAAHKGYDDIVALLLDKNAPVNCRVIEDLSTPLHKACAGGKPGHLVAVKQLLAAGADVHALNKWRETPLLTAANHGQAAAVEELLNAGADPCKCTDTGWSPLSIAAYKGHDDVVRLLLERDAPTEEADPTLSALLQAATKGLPDTVELLLRHGADHNVTTKKGDTALSILVEQNLIDAAVEMVTVYNASVTRCSRDRKKIQRARLLINLRMKQQKEGLTNGSLDSDDDSDQDDSDADSKSALHHIDGSPHSGTGNSSKKKKKKAKPSSRETAEAQARAAEEALLLELEQESAKAQKDEAAANSKRNKKKKKKERERQQKQEEERIKKEKEEQEAAERESKRREREEREKKERAEKVREQKEREMREAAEREEKAAAKRREREEKERKQKELERKEREKIARLEKSNNLSNASPQQMKVNVSKDNTPTKKVKSPKSNVEVSQDIPSSNKSPPETKVTGNMRASKPSAKNRGWEKTSTPEASKETETQSFEVSSVIPGNNITNGKNDLTNPDGRFSGVQNSVEDQLENMANGVLDFLGFGSTPPSNNTFDSPKTDTEGNSFSLKDSSSSGALPVSSIAELPAVSVFRQEKTTELLRRFSYAKSASARTSNIMSIIDDHILKTVLFKWIIRGSCEGSHFLDPIIPSWTDYDALVTFFQRQLISEFNRSVNFSGNIEALKEAGSFIAEQCICVAKEVHDYLSSHNSHLSQSLSDVELEMSAREVSLTGDTSTIIAIDWAGRSQVYIPSYLFKKLIKSYRGTSNLLLSNLFVMWKRYEVKNMIVEGTHIDFRLSPSTLTSLAREVHTNIELYNDPLHSRR